MGKGSIDNLPKTNNNVTCSVPNTLEFNILFKYYLTIGKIYLCKDGFLKYLNNSLILFNITIQISNFYYYFS